MCSQSEGFGTHLIAIFLRCGRVLSLSLSFRLFRAEFIRFGVQCNETLLLLDADSRFFLNRYSAGFLRLEGPLHLSQFFTKTRLHG